MQVDPMGEIQDDSRCVAFPHDSLRSTEADSRSMMRKNTSVSKKQLPSKGPRINVESNCLNEIEKQAFDPNGPDYQKPSPGLNFLTVCGNQSCRAKGQSVYVNKNFGEFRVAEEAYSLQCPVCLKIAEPSTNCGFYMARWKFEGRLKNGEARELSGCADTDMYYTFAAGGYVEWAYLKVTITQLSSP